jgi:hypothetical protein
MKSILTCFLFLAVSCGKSPLYGPIKDNNNSSTDIQSALASDEQIWSDNRMHFALQWHSIPATGSNSSFSLKFWDSYQTNFLGPYNQLNQNVCVFLWMKMPDGSEHGSSPLVLTEKTTDNGSYYHLDDVYFIMPGKWQIRIRTVGTSSDCQGFKSDPYLLEKIVKVTIR